jgi:hypothetical protein
MTYLLVQFGSTLLPDYNEEFDIGRAVTKKAALDIPTGGALDLFGGARIQPGARALTKTCTMHSTTETGLMNAYETLMALVGTRAKLYRERIADGSWFWTWARFDKLAATRKYSGGSSRFFQDVSLTFTIFTPAWYSMSEEQYWISAEAGEENDLTTCGVEGDYGMLTLVLGGNLSQPNVVFEILATSLFIHVEVVNTTNGYIWSYDGTVHIGETLVVDCGEMSVLNNGVDDYAHFAPPSDRERWFELQVGNNRVSIAVDGDADIYIHFYSALA